MLESCKRLDKADLYRLTRGHNREGRSFAIAHETGTTQDALELMLAYNAKHFVSLTKFQGSIFDAEGTLFLGSDTLYSFVC